MKAVYRRRMVISFLISLVLILGALVGTVQAEPARPAVVKFEGTILELPAGGTKVGTWYIDMDDDGQKDLATEKVKVVEGTIIMEQHGNVEVGAEVVVVAKKPAQGELEAMLIRVKAPTPRIVYFTGRVTELTDTALVVNGIRIARDQNTVIEPAGALRVNAIVWVKAQVTADGFLALHIKVLGTMSARIVQLEGPVLSRPATKVGAWVIDVNENARADEGERVEADNWTVLVPDADGINVGDMVDVMALRRPEGVPLARIIREGGAFAFPEPFDFSGAIVSFPAGYLGEWVIGTHTVKVTAATRIAGVPEVGKQAEVKAWRFPDGAIHAITIRIEGAQGEEITFVGVIQEFPESLWGTWKIGDKEVLVLPGTEIDGIPQVGAEAMVRAMQRSDGTLVAREIVIEDGGEPADGERLHLIGPIAKINENPDSIEVNGFTILILDDTAVHGTLAVGKMVAVIARITDTGSYEGIDITVVD